MTAPDFFGFILAVPLNQTLRTTVAILDPLRADLTHDIWTGRLDQLGAVLSGPRPETPWFVQVRTDALSIENTADLLAIFSALKVPGVCARRESFADGALEMLLGLTGLRSLDLRDSSFADADAKTLARADELTELMLSRDQNKGYFTDKLLTGIAACPSLRSLALTGVRIGTQDWSALGSLASLERLTLHCPEGWVGAQTDGLAPLAGLTSLSLSQWPFTDEDLGFLGSFTRLRYLALGVESGTGEMTGSGLSVLRDAPDLRILDLGSQRLDDDGVIAIAALRNLEVVKLGVRLLTDRGLRALADLRKLRRITIGGEMKLTPAGLSALATLPALEEIDIASSGLTPLQLVTGLGGHSNFAKLQISSGTSANKLTGEALQRLAGPVRRTPSKSNR